MKQIKLKIVGLTIVGLTLLFFGCTEAVTEGNYDFSSQENLMISIQTQAKKEGLNMNNIKGKLQNFMMEATMSNMGNMMNAANSGDFEKIEKETLTIMKEKMGNKTLNEILNTKE